MVFQEMGLLKHILMKGVDGVNFNSCLLAQHEDTNVADADTGAAKGSAIKVPRIRGDVSTGGGDVEIIPMQGPSLFGSDTELVMEEKETLSEGGKSSSELGNEGDHDKGKQVKEVAFSDFTESSNESDHHVLDWSVQELFTSWNERKAKREALLRHRIARYRLRMTHQVAKNTKLAKKVRQLKKMETLDKGREAIQMLAKNTIEHAKVVEALQKELQNARDDMRN